MEHEKKCEGCEYWTPDKNILGSSLRYEGQVENLQLTIYYLLLGIKGRGNLPLKKVAVWVELGGK